MTKAFIFDCFGVLTTDGWLPLKQEYFGDQGAKYEYATELNKQVNHHLIPYDRFVTEIADLAERPADEIQRRLESNVANTALLDFIQANIYGRYRLGILSNAGADWLDRLFTPEQLGMFDAVALSYEIGAIKPQPEAYQTIAHRLDTPPEECLLIDDQASFCTGAEHVGMPAIHYRSLEATLTRLGAQLRLDASPLDR